MVDWLRLRELAGSDFTGKVPDVVLGLVLSPYEVPDAVRGYRTSDHKLKIEFRYIDGDEPSRRVQIDPFIQAMEGRHSGRLLSLAIDMNALGAKSVGLSISMRPIDQVGVRKAIDSAFEGFAKRSGSNLHHGLDTARRILATREADLFHQLAD